MSLPRILEKYRSDIEAEIKTVIDWRESGLYDMMRYHLGWIDETGKPVQNGSGKAVRPALCLFSCEAVGGDYHLALPAAAALELVHNFSLIHDDIQDNDRERRHRPTVWTIWGKAQAINAGTAMRILANVALTRLGGASLTLDKRCWVGQRLDEVSLRLIEGQYLDISYEERFDITVKDYLVMIEGKTVALLAGSMEIGAMIGTDNPELISALKNAGHQIGLAFQIKDDILGIWGNQKETGKSAGNDIRRRKKSFPVVYSIEHATGALKHELIEIYMYSSLDEMEVTRVLEILEHCKAREAAQSLVESYCQSAKQILHGVSLPSAVQSEADELIDFLSSRDF